ncbi:hypothetical protein LPB03_11105 [Polaribacter vadi]|uniref:Uncharacterized protein n=1 Tax=Polaribacter vadi TaxID=1774273 RepID=A0A1B8TSK2_9FLAO|nr:hypothetical protein [Polaribacter vadi]AOW17967.1 hypothetical protein LPB03_11105 [Polaribacter vadi]OBY62693.1 hypothetical protein LPB3_11115 [Polaribacter vadi]
MQTRDYDDYIYIASTLGFRKVDDSGLEIDASKETDGYCNLYANNISVSYLHSMNTFQINAIHYFEENHDEIFFALQLFLNEKYTNPEKELGFRSVNILDEHQNEMCFTEYTFIDLKNQKINIKMHKNRIITDK